MAEYTPWGEIQHSTQIIRGFRHVITAGHGGVLISESLFAKMPESARKYSYWGADAKKGAFEEDCNWSIPYVVFAAELTEYANGLDETEKAYLLRRVSEAPNVAKNWCFRFYEDFFGVELKYRDSISKDTELEKEIFSKFYHAVAAWGEGWNENIPKDRVGLKLLLGGKPEECVYKLVDRSLYDDARKLGRSVIPFTVQQVQSFEDFKL